MPVILVNDRQHAKGTAVWFGLQVIVPAPGVVDWFAVLVGTVAFLGMVRWKWEIVPVVLGAGAAGLIFRMFFWKQGQ